jgi:hypothetical protein
MISFKRPIDSIFSREDERTCQEEKSKRNYLFFIKQKLRQVSQTNSETMNYWKLLNSVPWINIGFW